MLARKSSARTGAYVGAETITEDRAIELIIARSSRCEGSSGLPARRCYNRRPNATPVDRCQRRGAACHRRRVSHHRSSPIQGRARVPIAERQNGVGRRAATRNGRPGQRRLSLRGSTFGGPPHFARALSDRCRARTVLCCRSPERLRHHRGRQDDRRRPDRRAVELHDQDVIVAAPPPRPTCSSSS